VCGRVEAAMLDGAGKFQMIRYVTWYLALPYTYANTKVVLSFSLVLVVVGEMLVGSNYGLGRIIWDSMYIYDIPLAWSGIILLGLVGLGINKALDALKPKIINWE
jgi:ABC-type nitrate/sulfonate/bicarbonate transport system permease component